MDPKAGFDAAMERAKHLLTMYEILHDTRQRRVRADWAASFKKLMRWPAGEQIDRVDGKDRNSMLILRQTVGIDREHFAHDMVSELLRSAVVAAISAVDRYMHDQVVKHCWKLLGRREDQIPKELLKVALSPLVTRRALEKLRSDANARPGSLVKKALQERLHRDYTFQSADGIERAAKLLGLRDFWGEVASRLPGPPTKGDVKDLINEIARRRNKIVHEADLIPRTRHAGFKLRDIAVADARNWVSWIDELISATDDVIADQLS